MEKAKVIIAICILIAGLFGYVIGKQSTRISPVTNTTQLNLPYEQIKVSGIDNTQQKQIEDYIATFYNQKGNNDVERVLSLFTPPSNKQEQDELDFLLGNDYTTGDEKPLPRLFSTQGYRYTVDGYYVRDITGHNDATTVSVDEMRAIYSGGEYVGYTTTIASMVFDIVTQSNDKLRINRYYHKDLQTPSTKYEGFTAQ